MQTQIVRDPSELAIKTTLVQSADGKTLGVIGEAYRFTEGVEGRIGITWSFEAKLRPLIDVISGHVSGPFVNGTHVQLARAALAECCGDELVPTWVSVDQNAARPAANGFTVPFYALVAHKCDLG